MHTEEELVIAPRTAFINSRSGPWIFNEFLLMTNQAFPIELFNSEGRMVNFAY